MDVNTPELNWAKVQRLQTYHDSGKDSQYLVNAIIGKVLVRDLSDYATYQELATVVR